MTRRVWAWLRRKPREGGASADVQELLRASEDQMHEAEVQAEEAQELTASLRQMRVENGFRERMVLKIQGGLR